MSHRLLHVLGAVLSVLPTLVGPLPAQTPSSSRPSSKAGGIRSRGEARRDASAFALPETTLVLGNGLTVVVSEDRRTPNVAVELWFRAGARYEPPGEWGIAHFYEHIAGPTRVRPIPGRVLGGNAQTRRDFTRYYLLVPREALEYALALQSDRLDFPVDSLTEARLAANRQIVLNEYRGYEARAFGFGSAPDVRLLENGFGMTHPYGRPLQLNADVERLTPEDLRRWSATHGTPSNAILLVVGNISLAELRPLLDRYFAALAPERPGPARLPGAALLAEEPRPTVWRRERLEVAAPTGRLLAVWATPPYGSADADYLALFAGILAAPDVGRLYRRMVARERLATGTSAEALPEELAGAIRATVVLSLGANERRAEAIFQEEVERLTREGPSPAELRVARALYLTAFAHRLERLGFQESRAEVLGEGALYQGDAGAFRRTLARIATATPGDVSAAARRWVAGHGYLLAAMPRPSGGTGVGVDHARPIVLPPPAPPRAPSVLTSPLPGGPVVAAVHLPGTPLVHLALVLPAPRTAGGATLSSALGRTLTDHAPGNGSARAAAWRACLAAACELDIRGDVAGLTISVDALASELPTVLRALGSVLSPAPLDEHAVERALEEERSAGRGRDTDARAEATLRSILGGGSGGAADPPLDRAHLEAFRRGLPRGRATLVIVGALGRDLPGALRQAFPSVAGGGGDGPGEGPAEGDAPARGSVVWLIDEPTRGQALLLAGEPLPPLIAENLARVRLAADLAGARINANLRVRHEWSYGASAALARADDGTPLLEIRAEVDGAHAADAVAEIRRELSEPVPTEAELERTGFYRQQLAREIVGGETPHEVAAGLARLALAGLPLAAAPRMLARAAGIDSTDVKAALGLLRPGAAAFVVVGNAAVLRPQLAAAGITVQP